MAAPRMQIEVNKAFCVKLLKLYLPMRSKDRINDGLAGAIITSTAKVVKLLTGQSTDKDLVTTINTFVDRINKLKTFPEHISLIRELASCANKSQLQKFALLKQMNLTEQESIFSLFLHAIRNYIVSILKHPDSSFNVDFKNTVAALIADYDRCDQELTTAREHPNPYIENAKTLEEKRNNIIIELAYLDIPEFRHMVVNYKLLEHFRHLNDDPSSMLNILQADFMEKFFDKKIRPRDGIQMSLEEYKEKALLEDTREKETAMAAAAAAAKIALDKEQAKAQAEAARAEAIARANLQGSVGSDPVVEASQAPLGQDTNVTPPAQADAATSPPHEHHRRSGKH